MIRDATFDDLPQLVELGRVMHAESPRFARLTFSAGRLHLTLAALIEAGQFLRVGTDEAGAVVGGMAGMVTQHWASDDLVANELALFVAPEYRGGLLAVRLLTRYLQWAAERGAVIIQAGVTTGVDTETTARLYERMGLKRCGVILEA